MSLPAESTTPVPRPARFKWVEATVLALLIAFTSCGVVQKYLGLPGVAAFCAGCVVVVLLFARFHGKIPAWFSTHLRILRIAFLAFLAICFTIVYPIEDSRGVGKSSDRDQGLNLASSLLMAGEYPYYANDDFAGPLSVLPGSIVLATPFVAIGNSAFQNLFWIAAALLFLSWHFKNKLAGLILMGAYLALSPAAMHEFISGGDLLSNGIFVAIFSMLAVRTWGENSSDWKWLLLTAVLMGVGLASRPNFFFILPLFGAAIWSKAGLPRAILASGAVFVVIVAITLPFYLANSEGFTPLIARAKIAISGMPWAGNLVIAGTLLTTAICALILLLRPTANPQTAFARAAALVILAPMLLMVILQSIASGTPNFQFMSDRFGLMYVPFALLGYGNSVKAEKLKC